MKIIEKIALFLIILLTSFLLVTDFSYAVTNKIVNDENELKDAIQKASNGDVIELAQNIVLKAPIEITQKEISIRGNGHSISRESSNWSPNGNNGTLITAGAGAKLTLINLVLKDSEKYGVQAYNGGHVVLNGVTISNCGYGAILANAGTVEVKDLTLHKNGTPNNNGIEIAKGDNTAKENIPLIIMNGTLSSTEKENVVYVAQNNPNLKNFEVENTDNTLYKILVNDKKIVIVDEKNTILYQSNTISNIEIEGEKYDKKITTKNNKKENKKDITPKTGIETPLTLATLIATVSMIAIIRLKRKEMDY